MLRLTALPLCFVASLTLANDVDLSPRTWPEGELQRYENLFGAEKPLAESKTGIVVSTTAAAAARAGLEALNRGGSAVDAVMTHALAEITLWASCCVSHAGFMDLMVFEAATGEVHHLNGGWNTILGEDDPLSIPGDGVPSGRASLVPGFMAGLEAAHGRFGKLPFAALFGPAIYFAEEGFEVLPMLEGMIEARKDVLSRRPETKAVFTKEDGGWYVSGDRFSQPELAHTLRRVAEQGADYMYKGALGRKAGRGGAVRGRQDDPRGPATLRADLEGAVTLHLPRLRSARHRPAESRRRQHGRGAEPRRAGGPRQPRPLHRIPGGAVPAHPHRPPDGHHGHLAHPPRYPHGADRAACSGIATAPPQRTTKEAAKKLWQTMQTDGWDTLNVAAYEWRPEAASGNHSDAVVAVDADGNAAALLHTINTALWGTTGIFVDGVAIADSGKYQQTKIARAGPGRRLPIETNPVLITRNGKPVLVSSSIGMGVHEQTYQAIVNVLEYGLDPKAAAEAPRCCGR